MKFDRYCAKKDRENLLEAMKVVKSYGYKVLKEAEEDELDTEIKDLVKELADYTGNDADDAEVTEDTGITGHAVTVAFGNEEYECYKDYDEAEAAAIESVKDLLDDIGVGSIRFENIGGIEKYVNADWFDDAKREDAEFYVSDIKSSDPERFKEEFGDVDEDEAVEKCLEDWEEDSIEWYINNFGKEDFADLVKEKNLINLDFLAETIVDTDGVANELARYDGEEIELNDWYVYRIN